MLRAVRSRVVNAKRTDLSKGIRHKIVSDNCTPFFGNLRGWNKDEFASTNPKRLVRGFFGHTRFATSSKATLDGTHPHQWSPRKLYRMYPFQSSLASSSLSDSNDDINQIYPKSNNIGVESFITHNGDFEFYKIHGKYYDTEAIQKWLVKTLHVPMPTTVDSAAIAGMMDLLRSQGSFALSARYALCFELGGGGMSSMNPIDANLIYPQIDDYEEMSKIFEKAESYQVIGRNQL